jgi:hypothetical protein
MPFKDLKKRKEYQKKYQEENKEKRREYDRKRNKEKMKEYRENYYQKNKSKWKWNDKRRDYEKKRRQIDPMYKLIDNTRRRVRDALKNNKSKHTNEYLQCSNQFLYNHIKSQLPEGITMNDLGNDYHIDHIIPIMYDNPTKEEIIFRLGWYNLQVLSAEDNLKKSNNEPTINEKIKLVNNLIKYHDLNF